MFVTVINDCKDENAMARQAIRSSSLFKCDVSTVGVDSFRDIEAAGNIVEALDAADGNEGVILVNVAPRHGKAKKWLNGTPFGYFWYKDTLVVATIDGFTWSIAKKFGIIEQAFVTDIPTVIDHAIAHGWLNEKFRNRIVNSQFRSYDYMPRLAKWIKDGNDFPKDEFSLNDVPDVPLEIWWVDNFGNCKTTILPEDIQFEHGKKVQTRVGEITCYNMLRDVPNDETGLIIGSSGFEDKRFVELVIQGKSAAEHFKLRSGDILIDM